MKNTATYPKRLIEVDLPIKRISVHARREKSIRHGHISTLHIWWARRPLAACRAVICAALWPDPADELCPEEFRKTARERMARLAKDHLKLLSKDSYPRFVSFSHDKRKLDDNVELRKALLDFIADFANWDNSTKKEYLETGRALTQAAHEALGGTRGTKPFVVDPFAGGGAIPLEALRVGADAFASDIYDVPVFLNQIMFEELAEPDNTIAEDYRYWGEVLRRKVQEQMSDLFPTDESGDGPFAYFWSRKVWCEGPACGRMIPVVGNPHLSRRNRASHSVAFEYTRGNPIPKILLCQSNDRRVRSTTRGGAAVCECGYTTPVSAVRRQLSKQQGGSDDSMLLAVGVMTKDGKKRYRLPVQSDLDAVKKAQEIRIRASAGGHATRNLSVYPDEKLWGKAKMNVGLYGISTWEHVFTARQLIQLCTFQEQLAELSSIGNKRPISKAVLRLLALTINKLVDYSTSLCRWVPGGEFVAATIGGEKKLPMMWDYVEVVSHANGPGSWSNMVDWVGRVIKHIVESVPHKATVVRVDARIQSLPNDSAQAVITDPPYYDAIWYGDLSDLFSVWLRRTMSLINLPLDFDVVAAKEAEIIKSVFSERDGLSPKDEAFYEKGMTEALRVSREVLQPTGVGVIVFAHKSTSGWEAILSALIDAGWVITGSWPIDTEREARMTSLGQAALASSVHIVCRPRENPDGSIRTDDVGDWRDVLSELPKRIHEWVPRLAEEGVVGADAIFACLGPALEIFSRYSRVEKASGELVTLKEYLEYVWAAVAKEALTMIFVGADATGFEEDARLTAMWLWTLSTGGTNGNAASDDEDSEDDEEEATSAKGKVAGFVLKYDAARKIAQGLGAHLEALTSLVEIKGKVARLLPVAERTRSLFAKDEAAAPAARRKKKETQLKLGFLADLEDAEESGGWGLKGAPRQGETVLDRVHQAMILFAAGRSEALRRFLVDEGAGRDERFWRLAQALSALYPSSSDEKRWVDGVLARKKGLGF